MLIVIRQSEMVTRVRLSEILDAFEWVSAVGPFENEAYVSRETGKVWLVSDFDDAGEEAPADATDESLYLTVPSKSELDLGRSLALHFAAERLPERSAEIRSIFGGPGAYGRFKSLLEAAGMLEAWYAYESSGIDQALRAWAAENDIELVEEAL
jgi:hypothetical protein